MDRARPFDATVLSARARRISLVHGLPGSGWPAAAHRERDGPCFVLPDFAGNDRRAGVADPGTLGAGLDQLLRGTARAGVGMALLRRPQPEVALRCPVRRRQPQGPYQLRADGAVRTRSMSLRPLMQRPARRQAERR